jgi:outer membrane receptor for ferric coprogen and ferric-rhodotorulic acid
MDEFAAGNYDADEKITAFYAMIEDKIGDNLTLIAGARVENTKIDYTGYSC